MNNELLAALDSIEREKGVSKDVLFEAIEVALVSAYKRNYDHAMNTRVEINRESGMIRVFTGYTAVGKVINPQTELSLEEAMEIDNSCQAGDVVEREVTPRDFGRIAAQTAKQVVIQRIREAEREIIFEEYLDRIDEVLTGLVQRYEQRNAIIELGKTEAILPLKEQIPGERLKQGERVRALITEVKRTSKGPQIMLSRTHSGMLKRLFENEVPEISKGLIVIKGAAREPGFRSKMAVYSINTNVDPVGACVGPKGARVQAVSNELNGEKIDIIRWSEQPEEYIKNALSPAQVSGVVVNNKENEAKVVVPDNQLSLAIGREGQNVRLAARVTGWRIDIISESQNQDKNKKLQEDIGAEDIAEDNNTGDSYTGIEEQEDSGAEDSIAEDSNTGIKDQEDFGSEVVTEDNDTHIEDMKSEHDREV